MIDDRVFEITDARGTKHRFAQPEYGWQFGVLDDQQTTDRGIIELVRFYTNDEYETWATFINPVAVGYVDESKGDK